MKRTRMSVFDKMGSYWAEIADQHQTERQVQFLKRQLKPDGLMLDVACGTGRHLIALTAAGYDVVGLDVSVKLLNIAKCRLSGAQVVRGDMRLLPFKAGAFAAALSMDTSLGYLPTETDDAESLAEMRRVLRQGGEAIVDVFNRRELSAKYCGKQQAAKEREYPSFFLIQKRTVSTDGGWLCDSWTVRDRASAEVRSFKHVVRLYEATALQVLLERAGFRVKGVWGDYEGQGFTDVSSRLIFLASAL